MVTWDQVRSALRGGDVIIPNPTAGELAADGLPPGTAAVLTTSGSTGEGKHVMLSATALLAAADASRALFGRATWTCCLPVDYVAGFMTLVRSYVSGTVPLIVGKDLSRLDPPHGPNAISLVATQLHRALSDSSLTAVLRRYDVILVGGSRIDPALLAAGRAAGLGLTTSYGMSETCGGCVYDGKPLPGIDIGIEPLPEAAGTITGTVAAGDAGRITIAGPQLFTGYLGDAAATADALIGERLWTRDRGTVVAGQLSVLGRIDSVVISGGVNVDLDDVDRILAGEPVPATVIGVPDREWGTRIVLVAERGRSLDEWRKSLAVRLGSAALPKELIEVAKLPRNERGKIDRAALGRLVEGP